MSAKYKCTFVIFFLSIIGTPSLFGMKVSGNLNIARPTRIIIRSVDGTEIIRVPLDKNGNFSSENVDIVPDVYIFEIGDSRENVFLDNTDITIKGFLDANSIEKSQLEFTGIEQNERFQELYQHYKSKQGDINILKTFADSHKANASMLSALAYLIPQKTYENSKSLLDLIPASERKNESLKWLQQQTDSLSKYRIGGSAYDFTAIDEQGKTVRLSDFKGKYVLLDFWASWCGPCKLEIRKLKTVYPNYEDKDIVFISLSVDDTKADWDKGLKSEQIPWIVLWDKDGGGLVKTKLKDEYGFKSIPFVVLIDREGNIVARNLRGTAVEKALLDLK